ERVVERQDVPATGAPDLPMGRAKCHSNIDAPASAFIHDPGDQRQMNEKITQPGYGRDHTWRCPGKLFSRAKWTNEIDHLHGETDTAGTNHPTESRDDPENSNQEPGPVTKRPM